MHTSFRISRDHGFSLIEVLVALFVLSIGMLGIAALFLGTIQDSRAAIYRSKATSLAWDMAERIRANRSPAALYNVSTDDNGTDRQCTVTHVNSSPTNCSSSQLEQHDIFEWKASLRDNVRGLPSGNGNVIRVDSENPPRFTINVTWMEGDGDIQGVQVVTQL